ncbi:hypothetical protein AB0I35_31490 [Nocardia sp. NPDC050378]|uniref:hypothetical protein n=1 Tax=Nocardia sp. NPDC050378 TaxID=3155400 RepID=UPI0033CF623D
MADSLTRSEFDLAVHLGTAGSVGALKSSTIEAWRANDPSWKGKHWAYTEPDDRGAHRLHPINISPRTKSTD